MPGSTIVSSDTQQFNNFTNTRSGYSLDLRLGANTANSTPTIVFGDPATYRFALRMPSLGYFDYIKFFFESQTSGSPVGTFDLRVFQVPWDAPDRHPIYDLVYEMREVMLGTQREHKMTDRPLPFANRVAYLGSPPGETGATTYPRNFMWLEVKPNDPTTVSPIVRANFKFQV